MGAQEPPNKHTIIVWPSSVPHPRWTSGKRDATTIAMLDGYRRVGIDPRIGQ